MVGAALAAAVSLGIGHLCFRLKGPFFSLATIAFLEVVRLLAIHFNGLTGGSAGLVVPLNLGWAWMIFREKFNYLYIAFGLLALTPRSVLDDPQFAARLSAHRGTRARQCRARGGREQPRA